MRSAISESFFQYFPPTKAFSACGLHVAGMGFERVGAGEIYPRREHPADHLFSYKRGRVLSSYVIEVLTAGEGTYESDRLSSTRLSAGDVCLIFPEVRHRYRPTPDVGWSKWWVEFQGPLADQWMKLARLSASRAVLAHADYASLVEDYEKLAGATQINQPVRPMLISSIVLQIIAQLQIGAPNPAAQPDPRMQLVRAAKTYIDERMASPRIEWEDLASELGVGYSSLRKLFGQTMGSSLGQYHLSLRERRAVELLRNSGTPISEIADTLGFDSIYYFSRFIRIRTGFSPRALRARAGEAWAGSDAKTLSQLDRAGGE